MCIRDSPYITEKDPTAQPIEGEADVDLRDTENVPFTYEGGIEAFMQNEVCLLYTSRCV